MRSEVRELLIRARAIQAEHGNCQYSMYDKGSHHRTDRRSDGPGSVCARGAIYAGRFGYEVLRQSVTYGSPCRALSEYMKDPLCMEAERALGFDPEGSLAQWNNRPETTLTDVLNLFDTALAKDVKVEVESDDRERELVAA